MSLFDKYPFLRNTYACKIEFEGETFPDVLAAYCYARCANENDTEQFLNKRGYWCSGLTALSLSKNIKPRDDWKDYRLDVMYKLLEEKFYHNEYCRDALCKTGTEILEMDSDTDEFWGVKDGKGQNMFGKMLMEIRQNIQKMDRDKKVIVAGGRSFNDYKKLKENLDYFFSNMHPTIVCGEARGADTLGKQYANDNKLKVLSYPANWSTGRDAGYRRNEEMAKVADCLVAFWDGKSSGTRHMIETMRKLGKPVRIVKY